MILIIGCALTALLLGATAFRMLFVLENMDQREEGRPQQTLPKWFSTSLLVLMVGAPLLWSLTIWKHSELWKQESVFPFVEVTGFFLSAFLLYLNILVHERSRSIQP